MPRIRVRKPNSRVRSPISSISPVCRLYRLAAAHRAQALAAVHVSQSLYTQIGRKPQSRQWSVPMCVKGDGEKTCEMLGGQAADLFVGKSCPKAVMPNVDGRGYYRYAFEDDGWNGLVAAAPFA